VLAFALQPACENVLRFFGDDIHPGDVILHNDVFSGGNQNNDVAVFKPIFHGRSWLRGRPARATRPTSRRRARLQPGGARGLAGGPAHSGGEDRRAWQAAARRLNLIFANIRLKIVEEDIRAQIGGCTVGERGFKR